MPGKPHRVSEGRWSMHQRDLGVIFWIAFLAASVGTFILFALIDPGDIQNAWMEEWNVGRKLAYSLGFLFLFGTCLLCSWLTVFMIRSGPRRGHHKGKGDRPMPRILDPHEENPEVDFEDIK